MMTVVAQAYVEGVSTRRVDDLVKAMGIEGISASEVSRMAASLDEKVAEFKDRPLDAGPYRYVWLDGLTQKVRERGQVVNGTVVLATTVTAEGRREVIGIDIVTTEDTAAWTAFFPVADDDDRPRVERSLQLADEKLERKTRLHPTEAYATAPTQADRATDRAIPTTPSPARTQRSDTERKDRHIVPIRTGGYRSHLFTEKDSQRRIQ